MNELTVKTYHFILDWAVAHKGNTPTQRQIAAGCGYTQATAHNHIGVLIEANILEYIDNHLCIVRSQFTVSDNAYEAAELERTYPDVTLMKCIPKDCEIRDEAVKESGGLEHLGITVGKPLDSEFLAAKYPKGWKYVNLNELGSIHIFGLFDKDTRQVATLRFERDKYEASIYFWERK